MFDLNKAIEEWCQSIHANAWNSEANIDELKDHLHCEIERLTRDGLSDEQAFHRATERIGNAEDLRIEHSKNRGPLPSMIRKTVSNLLPTIALSIGMLLGGLGGAYLGSFASNELVTVACYVGGAIGGAGGGTMIGLRWRSRWTQSLSHD
jgi:hypothetical protein